MTAEEQMMASNVGASVSEQSRRFAELSAATRDRMNDLDLLTVRDVCDALGETAGNEPEGVTYAEVDVGGVPALWCIPAGCDDANVLLFNHAGGSVVFSMRSDRKAAAHLARAAGIRALVVDFRRSPENKFPAQLDDVETAYHWLLSQGYAPEQIASGGHSVGGNLAVGLAIRLRDQGAPMPGAILAVSAWCDLELKNPTLETNAGSDKMLSTARLEFFRESWIGGTGVAPDDPRVNLLHADLAGLPPTNIYYGADELLVGEIIEFARRAEAAGLDTTLHGVPGGQHLWLLGAGKVPETDAAIAELGHWLRSKLALNALRG
jgi:monoterpene epsilon-lactone hydrolase